MKRIGALRAATRDAFLELAAADAACDGRDAFMATVRKFRKAMRAELEAEYADRLADLQADLDLMGQTHREAMEYMGFTVSQMPLMVAIGRFVERRQQAFRAAHGQDAEAAARREGEG